MRHHGRLQEKEADALQHETERTNSETVLSASIADGNVIHQEVDAIDHRHHVARILQILIVIVIETKTR